MGRCLEARVAMKVDLLPNKIYAIDEWIMGKSCLK